VNCKGNKERYQYYLSKICLDVVTLGTKQWPYKTGGRSGQIVLVRNELSGPDWPHKTDDHYGFFFFQTVIAVFNI
jgi:hypothetical protein